MKILSDDRHASTLDLFVTPDISAAKCLLFSPLGKLTQPCKTKTREVKWDKLDDLVIHNKAETKIILLGKIGNVYFDARSTNKDIFLKQRSATTMIK